MFVCNLIATTLPTKATLISGAVKTATPPQKPNTATPSPSTTTRSSSSYNLPGVTIEINRTKIVTAKPPSPTSGKFIMQKLSL